MSTQSTISKKDAIANPDSQKKGRMTVPKFMARKGSAPLVFDTDLSAVPEEDKKHRRKGAG